MDKEPVKYVIRNARVKYAKVYQPDEQYPPAKWSVNIYPTDEDRHALQAHGVEFREDKDGDTFVVAKRKTLTRSGAEQTPPRVVGPKKEAFTEPIGNGSVCNISVLIIDYTFQKKHGKTVYLDALQVVNHVEYAPKEELFDEVDGSTVNSEDDPF